MARAYLEKAEPMFPTPWCTLLTWQEELYIFKCECQGGTSIEQRWYNQDTGIGL